MTLMGVNLWSVLVAGIATMVVGFVWYSPLLLARPWMVAMGYDPEDKAKTQLVQIAFQPESFVCGCIDEQPLFLARPLIFTELLDPTSAEWYLLQPCSSLPRCRAV